jgi:entericidin A
MTKTLASLITALSLTLTGCNTVKGLGQDIQKVGERMEDAAKRK